MKRLSQLIVLLALSAMMASAGVILSTQGILNDPNQVFEQSFSYDPATQGARLQIQTYGYGGSSNAPGGRNGAGTIILAGGFDPIIGLFAGGLGAGGARINFNDDGTCAPGFGTTDAGICFDATLVVFGLAAGTYTVSVSAFSNFPGTTETSAFSGGGSFTDVTPRVRTNAFAVDVVASPEPMTSVLFGTGLLGIAYLARRRRA